MTTTEVYVTETTLTTGNGACAKTPETTDYLPLVMEGEEKSRHTADLRTEVLLELATPNHLEHDQTIEHETATVAVERAKERRKIVVYMKTVSQILLYVLPTLIVLCLILYWTIPSATDDYRWLTMLAAVLGCACFVDFVFFQYFSNRAEGTDLLSTVAKFRSRLQKSGRRF